MNIQYCVCMCCLLTRANEQNCINNAENICTLLVTNIKLSCTELFIIFDSACGQSNIHCTCLRSNAINVWVNTRHVFEKIVLSPFKMNCNDQKMRNIRFITTHNKLIAWSFDCRVLKKCVRVRVCAKCMQNKHNKRKTVFFTIGWGNSRWNWNYMITSSFELLAFTLLVFMHIMNEILHTKDGFLLF